MNSTVRSTNRTITTNPDASSGSSFGGGSFGGSSGGGSSW